MGVQSPFLCWLLFREMKNQLCCECRLPAFRRLPEEVVRLPEPVCRCWCSAGGAGWLLLCVITQQFAAGGLSLIIECQNRCILNYLAGKYHLQHLG